MLEWNDNWHLIHFAFASERERERERKKERKKERRPEGDFKANGDEE